MSIVIIKNSVITGIHRTKVGAHEAIPLIVQKDDSVQHIDPDCMLVKFPEDVAASLMKEITYPKNEAHKRPHDQLVEDVLGMKVGNVPANICGAFRHLLDSTRVKSIKCFSIGIKPRPSVRPSTNQKFRRSLSGMNRRGGGLVIDCHYELNLSRSADKTEIVNELKHLLSQNNGDEVVE